MSADGIFAWSSSGTGCSGTLIAMGDKLGYTYRDSYLLPARRNDSWAGLGEWSGHRYAGHAGRCSWA